jgi:hypothetical protein
MAGTVCTSKPSAPLPTALYSTLFPEKPIMLRTLLPGLLLITAFATTQAETLLLDGLEVAEETKSERPDRGESKERVEARFGEPNEMIAAVGEPPISRWEYPGFTVYFEEERVIHAVQRR